MFKALLLTKTDDAPLSAAVTDLGGQVLQVVLDIFSGSVSHTSLKCSMLRIFIQQ